MDANINVDLILSYPWLRKKQIAVYPHLGCLGVDIPERVYLTSKTTQRRKRKRKPQDLEEEALTAEVRAWNLCVPTEVGEPLEDYLFHDDDAVRYIASILRVAGGDRQVKRVVQVPGASSSTNPKVGRLIEGIRAAYDGTVLRESVWPNPPVRGPHGYGRIELKEYAEAKKMHHIFLTGPRREAMINLVKEWIRDEKVEDGYGEWVSPAFVVSKKGGRWRGVVDYRALNEATKPDNYPLPWIENMLVQFGRKALFTVLDLKDAFHQVPLHPGSRPCTCCSTPIGVKQRRVVVMGLRNGVPIFQRRSSTACNRWLMWQVLMSMT